MSIKFFLYIFSNPIKKRPKMSSIPTESPQKEQALNDYILNLPKDQLDAVRGNPDKVIDLIDDFAKQIHFMNVGKDKGNLIVEQIHAKKPKVAIELGGYVGYSAIYFAKELPPDAKYYSFELNPDFAKIAQSHIDLAGLSDKIEIIVGPAAENLVKFAETHDTVDLVFLDHWKDLYTPDLRVLESLQLIKPGTVVTADNVIRPGAPDFAKYIQSSPQQRKKIQQTVPNATSKDHLGDWRLVYDAHVIKPYEGFYDGVAIAHVTGYE